MYLFNFPSGLSGGSKETSYSTNYNTSRATNWTTTYGTARATSYNTSRVTTYGTGWNTTFVTSVNTSNPTIKPTGWNTTFGTSANTSRTTYFYATRSTMYHSYTKYFVGMMVGETSGGTSWNDPHAMAFYHGGHYYVLFVYPWLGNTLTDATGRLFSGSVYGTNLQSMMDQFLHMGTSKPTGTVISDWFGSGPTWGVKFSANFAGASWYTDEYPIYDGNSGTGASAKFSDVVMGGSTQVAKVPITLYQYVGGYSIKPAMSSDPNKKVEIVSSIGNTSWSTNQITSFPTSWNTSSPTSQNTTADTTFATGWNTSNPTSKNTSRTTTYGTSRTTGFNTSRGTGVTTTFSTSHTTDHITYG